MCAGRSLIMPSSLLKLTVNSIPIADLPEDEEGLREWCESCWVEKDKRLEAMISETVKA